jgi:hypothetical protein
MSYRRNSRQEFAYGYADRMIESLTFVTSTMAPGIDFDYALALWRAQFTWDDGDLWQTVAAGRRLMSESLGSYWDRPLAVQLAAASAILLYFEAEEDTFVISSYGGDSVTYWQEA